MIKAGIIMKIVMLNIIIVNIVHTHTPGIMSVMMMKMLLMMMMMMTQHTMSVCMVVME